MVKMAIEVGGTFTDLIWIEDDIVRSHKVPSTPHDASIGVLDGLNTALDGSLSGLEQLFHGSTVATNAVIERKGCKTALLTTAGFKDILLLQRQLRSNVYAIECHKPEPLVPLNLSIEANERVDALGRTITPLDENALIATLDLLLEKERPEALAVCLLHAYRSPKHEQRIREIIAKRMPDLPVVLSSDVLPTFREYERASTTAMAAYLVPLVGRYLERLEQHLESGAPGSNLFVMQSSGGVLPSTGSHARGVEMLNSGPAAGVIGAVRMAEAVGDKDVITLDVGGTSADICLIAGGAPGITSETEVDGLPVGLPSIDIANIGAGGGSLGWIDAGGMLQVGPRSAGARPGPACYGHGGEVPALTDALVELGWIRPERFLGGRMTLYPERATAALQTLGAERGESASAMAQAMIDISVAHVSQGVRLVSVQRGHDPKGYAIYAYGGMGPMIGALAATELKVNRVVVPPYPGLFSALGLLVADLKRIYRETNLMRVTDSVADDVSAAFARIRQQAETEFAAFGRKPEEILFEHELEMRFVGQGYELLSNVELDRLQREGKAYVLALFKATHETRYGAVASMGEVELVTFRLTASVATDSDVMTSLTRPAAVTTDPQPTVSGEISFAGSAVACQYFWRADLVQGTTITGAAVIEEPTATTLVPPGWTATVDHTGALILTSEA
ncbi:hydantoinase/oxoprolinase family protein [Rhizobium sp. P38BS-XIX]|uniref:hydantoinase/oxoprolinase family protein n=1 Tax=Rhizobium sp. P38BS-XIX TaxID=2726740 RepID=UPI0014569FA8|nr:hydantoinase/oxoprolinase family protein [Rhizobium sp. P38BS-XIX]NLR97380.1 hydantoinase/oxoprolinase family protein [Rhizobium sp. P38BS-XIX]